VKTEPDDLASFEQLADRYAEELNARFRTLNLFAQHSGEIGRTHEVFLRAILQRFLPGKFRCGSGFIVGENGVSRQQDIVVFESHALPLLLEIGDCLVVDRTAVAATIEVKTELDSSAKLASGLHSVMETKRALGGAWFAGLYAWHGVALDLALECFWSRFRDAKDLGGSIVPDAIYVRGQYLLMPNYDGRLETAPLHLLRLESGQNSEGVALLSLMERMWISGVQAHAEWPWWLSNWRARMLKRYEAVPWPDDLRMRVDERLGMSTV
jgi:hypothetical protein